MNRWLPILWSLLLVRPIVRLLIGVAVYGREHLAFKQPTIFVANHNSHLDAVVFMDLLPLKQQRLVRPVAAADYFERGPIRSFIWRRCLNVLPIRRDKVTRHCNPLQAMIDALDRGESLLIFPEGSRGDPEKLSEFRTGIAHVLAKRPHVPVVPVFMRNLGYNLPRGDLILVPLFCDVFIGAPRVIEGTRPQVMQHLLDCFTQLRAAAESIRRTDAPDDDR
jgi:1-acyl-sn-glycerol-3-phosphate acyltransferase